MSGEADNSWDGCIPAWTADTSVHPPLPEFQVPYYKQLIAKRVTDPDTLAEALALLKKRDQVELDKLLYPEPPEHPIQQHEVSDYVDLIDQIRDQDAREQAYSELRQRHRSGVEGLIAEDKEP